MVVRILIMVPIYGISSLIAIFSLDAAFIIDAIRDIYEVRYARDVVDCAMTECLP